MNRTSGKLLAFGGHSRFIGEITLCVTGGGLGGPRKDIEEHSFGNGRILESNLLFLAV